jgi:hypothetical protein
MKRTFKIYSKAKATILINTFSCTNEILKYIEQFMFFWTFFNNCITILVLGCVRKYAQTAIRKIF